MTAPPGALLTDRLKAVSRSFYLTLRILPKAVRPQISLAYLLARTSDTIADTPIVPVPRRLDLLRLFRARVLGQTEDRLELADCLSPQSHAAERQLLERAEESLALLATLAEPDRQCVRDVLATVTSGQELDLARFAGASPQNVIALQNDAELEDYTYRVAGCVGEFWTRLCRIHLFPEAPVEDGFLLSRAVDFGKGLQAVNILRDLPADLRQGRCYLPSDRLRTVGLTPGDLLDPAHEARLRPLYDIYLALAETRLDAGWEYTNALPPSCRRVRLACAWPVLFGLRTLAKLRASPILAPELHTKISRDEVRGLIVRSLVCYPSSAAWQRLPERARTGWK
jgi:farnesyl-diphosphate farnesyltransferase